MRWRRVRPSGPGPNLAVALPGPSFWLAAAIWMASIVLGLWATGTEATTVAWISFTTVGAYLAWVRPRHPVGWIKGSALRRRLSERAT